MKVEKCQVGYISHQKKTDWIWLAAFVFIGIAIFLTGYFWTHTRANVFTVVAVLMVGPADRLADRISSEERCGGRAA